MMISGMSVDLVTGIKTEEVALWPMDFIHFIDLLNASIIYSVKSFLYDGFVVRVPFQTARFRKGLLPNGLLTQRSMYLVYL